MKKLHIWMGLLVCALMLPVRAGAATIMDAPTVAETPMGEEAVAAERPRAGTPDVVDVTPEDELPAALSATNDALHDAVGDHTDWSPVSATADLSAGKYYLSGDLTGNLNVPAGESVDLCLNGHTLDAGGSGSVITVRAGATLRLCDCAGGGKVTGGKSAGGGGVRASGGTLELYGGSITGNQAVRKGEAASGGGVYILDDGIFRMYGGSIDHNQAKLGGGVYLDSGGEFAMTGGTIMDNTATERGGGVYLPSGSKFTMTGGTIADNTATEQGGGIYACVGDIATAYKLSGTPVIRDNTAASRTNNLYLAGGCYVSIPFAALTSDTQVGVSVETPGVFAAPHVKLSADDYRGCFTSDNADYDIGVNADNRLIVNAPVTVTYTIPAGVTGTAPAAHHCIAGETVVVDTQMVPTKDGYGFAGWTDGKNGTKTVTTVTPMEDTVLRPVFVVGFEESGKSTDIDMVYGVDAESIDLNEFVRPVDGNPDATFRFVIEGELLRGLKLVNDAGEEKGNRHILTGRPMVAGDYSLVFIVNQMGQSAVLFGLDPSPAITSGKLTLNLHVSKPAISAVDFDFAPPADLSYDGQIKAANVTPKKSVAGGVGAITLHYSPVDPVAVGTYQVYADVAEGTKYQAATGLTDSSWTFTITPADITTKVTLGTPQVSGGTTTIPITVTPADLLDGAEVIAAKYVDGMMTDIAWGRLSGNTLTFSGKQITLDSGWKVFFLSGDTHSPLCDALWVTARP